MQNSTADASSTVGALSNPVRLAALHRFNLLDTPSDPAFDRLTRLASTVLNAPVALVTLVDQDRQFFKSQIGVSEPWASRRETPLSLSFCQFTVAHKQPFIVEDAPTHPLVSDHLAVSELSIQAYAGIPLITSDGHALGSLCVMDHQPRQWTEREIDILTDLAAATMTEIERRGELIERQRIEQALVDVKQRYKGLFDNMHEGVGFIDPETQVMIEMNARGAEMLGYSPEELVGMPTSLLIAPSEHDQAMTVTETVLAGEQVPLYERMLRQRSGDEFPVEISLTLIRDAEGKPLYIQSAFRDLSERKQTEKEIEKLLENVRQQSAVLESMLESMADGVIVADTDGDILLFNAAAKALLGMDITGVPLTEWAEHYQPFYPDQVTPYASEDLPLARAIRGESVDGVEIFVHHPNQASGIYTSRSARPILDANGEITGGVVVIHDITKRKKSEQIIERQAEELIAANAELEAFGHTIAHGLKTPLSYIQGYAALLHDMPEPLSEESREMLEAIDRAVIQMAGMINSLLLLAKVRHGEEQIEVVRIEPVIQAALWRFEQGLSERGFSIALPDTFPPVMGYAAWIEEVFANLIGNAIKYTSTDQTDPSITIRSVRQGEMIRFEVQDNGLGIKPEDQQRLFDMFSRFHKSHAEGSGLGLSIVDRIVMRLGGEVGVESTPDQGSTFWFTLPAVKE